MASMEAARVKDLVSLLDRTERLLITFYYVERLTPAEIAAVLELTPSRVVEMLRVVRNRIQYALQGAPAQTEPADTV